MSFFRSSSIIPGKLSLDRITFLVFSPRLSLWSEEESERRDNMNNVQKFSSLLEMRLQHHLDPDFPQGIPSPLYKYHYRTYNDIDIQFGPVYPVRKKRKGEGDPEDKYIYQPSYYGLRIEYNPNKISLSDVKSLFNGFKNFSIDKTVVISRIDCAIDYLTTLNPELILCRGVKKNCVYGGINGVETVYFGRRTSSNMFRIYNKRQELIDSGDSDPGHDIWRIELEHSKTFPLSQTPDLGPVFDRITILPGAVVTDSEKDWVLQMLLENSLHNGSLQNTLQKLPKNTRIRYRDKLALYQEHSPFLEDPSHVCRRDFPLALSLVRSDIVKLFGRDIFLS